MAFRTFRQEASYAAPDIRMPSYTLLSMQRAVDFNRRKKLQEQQIAARKERDINKFDPKIDISSYQTDQVEINKQATQLIRDARNYQLNDGVIPSELHEKIRELQQRSKLTNIQKNKQNDYLKFINSSKVPYYNPAIDQQKILDAGEAQAANVKNRSERLDQAYESAFGVDSFLHEKQRTDYVKNIKQTTFSNMKSVEDTNGVTSVRQGTVKAPFMRPTGRMITTPSGQQVEEMEPGVTSDHVRDYLDSDEMGRVDQYYAQQVRDVLVSGIASKRASGDLDQQYKDLNDDEIADLMIDQSPDDFEYQKMVLAKRDLERRNAQDIRLSRKLQRDDSARRKQEDIDRANYEKQVVFNVQEGNERALEIIRANPNVKDFKILGDGNLELTDKNDNVTVIPNQSFAQIRALIPGAKKDISTFLSTGPYVTPEGRTDARSQTEIQQEQNKSDGNQLNDNYGGAFD